jgi:3-hydroxymyristoyl/3-hydroxydecanoyl-(acyl carrier protein) dehydratase
MRKFEIDQFLHENQWIASAVERQTESGGHHIDLDLSPSGHRLIRDRGLREFRQRVQAWLSAHCHEKISWGIRRARDGIWPANVLQTDCNFPQILSRYDDSPQLRILLDISSELGWFRGHFPGNPVLPGIVQVHWVVTATRFLFGMSDGPGEIKRLKFKSVVTPPHVIELALCRPTECEVQFDYSSLGQQHSQGRLIFEEHV